ncbi:MAG TPA: hypothetical protein H9702_07680 [Candidatus Merdibacter merdavium]|uniref:Uncharacterized protein n=1 Tax=Candidatus Merdibacter merdavium TaxID=2838692 RepID=A0A9D2SWI5_9FIRM|nr:hypothetical protein [Candidatus Merdibacter merdavium]
MRRFDLPGFLLIAAAITALMPGFEAISQGIQAWDPNAAVPLCLGLQLLISAAGAVCASWFPGIKKRHRDTHAVFSCPIRSL